MKLFLQYFGCFCYRQNEVKIERDPFITAEKYADHLKSMIAQAAVFRPRAVSGDDLCQSSRAFMAAPSIESVILERVFDKLLKRR